MKEGKVGNYLSAEHGVIPELENAPRAHRTCTHAEYSQY